MKADRTLPHDLDAERAALGAALLSPAAWAAVTAVLRPEDFYRAAHRQVFAAMARLAAKHVELDLLTVVSELRAHGELEDVGGPAYVSALADGIPRTANAPHYAALVREAARLRLIAKEAEGLLADAYDADRTSLAIAEGGSRRLAEMCARAEGGMWAKEAVDGYVADLVSGTLRPPMPTGYADLDALTGGLRPADLCIVAARPSTGKSTFSLGLALHLAEQQRPVVFIPLETSRRMVAAQLVSWSSGVSALSVERGTATDEEFAAVGRAATEMQDVPLFIEPMARTVAAVAASCRRLKDGRGLECAVVDYLQLLLPERQSDDKEREVASLSLGLKALAKELDIAVVALSQLSRAPETRKDKRPHISDLRGSGALEQDADLALLLFREEMHRPKPENLGVAECIVAKNRTGPTGVVKLAFDRSVARFRNLARQEEEY